MSFACLAEEGHDGGMDADYASAASEADDEATLEEEDAMAAQDGIDQKVSPFAGAVTGQSGNPRNITCYHRACHHWHFASEVTGSMDLSVLVLSPVKV